MTKRVAFFANKIEIENYFGFSSNQKNLFEPHYNLTPGQHIPVITSEKNELMISRIRWGKESADNDASTLISSEEIEEKLLKKKAERCIIPLSGFYVWKENRQKDHPFFVRMLNSPVMATAGIFYMEKETYFNIVMTESNALIHPMAETMPLLLDQAHSRLWLDSDHPTHDLLNETKNLFFLTDISVMRVHKKVNDPTLNHPSLVQPIPK